MKNIKSIALLAALLGFVSCGKNFDDLNVDPNSPDAVPAEFLLTNAQKTLADQYSGGNHVYFTNLWGQYFAQNNYSEESRYLLRPNNINFQWEWYFAETLFDLAEAKRRVMAAPSLYDPASDKNKLAVISTLEAMRWQETTDIFGPIPYSDALKGGLSRSPKYDSQRDIYLDLSRKLREAATDMDENSGSFGSADAIYAGDVAKWKKLANSLRLRVAMRMADAEPTAARTEVEAAFAGAMTSNDDNAYFHYLNGQPNNHPLNQARLERGDADWGLSNILIDKTLVPLADPRLPAFADERVEGGGYFGRPYGQDSDHAASESPDVYSQPSGADVVRGGGNFGALDILAPEAVGRLMSYAEVCFIAAEAIERGWTIPGTAADWYAKGVRASLEEWGVSDPAAVATYLAQPGVDYQTAAGDWKQKIGVQKWVALFMQGSQGWFEWRRLDFQKLEAPVDGAILDVGSRAAPVRATYPVNEQAQNSSNYNAALGLLGGPDALTTRVWWDVQ
ncbi:MAG: SusD/RagB family nutrient-binding outer membrane lipoprotein [Saprospiraceae bacterium]